MPFDANEGQMWCIFSELDMRSMISISPFKAVCSDLLYKTIHVKTKIDNTKFHCVSLINFLSNVICKVAAILNLSDRFIVIMMNIRFPVSVTFLRWMFSLTLTGCLVFFLLYLGRVLTALLICMTQTQLVTREMVIIFCPLCKLIEFISTWIKIAVNDWPLITVCWMWTHDFW